MAFPTLNALLKNWFGSHGRRHKAFFAFTPASGDYAEIAESDVTAGGVAVAYAEGTAEVPMGSSVAVSAGTGIAAGREVAINVTATANISLKLAGDGSTFTAIFPVGLTVLKWAVQGATVNSGTATVTNLY